VAAAAAARPTAARNDPADEVPRDRTKLGSIDMAAMPVL
jgi:hypothetical protein